MSDASEAKRWLTGLPRAGTGVEARQYDHCSFIEVVSASDHDRIMAERDELWKRATKFVMPGEMDTGEYESGNSTPAEFFDAGSDMYVIWTWLWFKVFFVRCA